MEEFHAHFLKKHEQFLSEKHMRESGLTHAALYPQQQSIRSSFEKEAHSQHLKLKRMINNEHAKEQREQLHEERQKKRVLYVFKKDLVAAYKESQMKKIRKELKVRKMLG